MVVTRIAPSPSGFLHAGNAVNFLLVDWLAQAEPGSQVHLRIDDVMLPDTPTQYLDDIFWALDWLGIGITDGPSGTADFRANHSQLDQIDRFRTALVPLQAAGVLFACACSRTDVARRATDVQDPCQESDLAFDPGTTAIRFRSRSGADPDAATRASLTRIGCRVPDIVAAMGDFVVWRRDDLPAYQLVSVVEDQRMGVDTIVRGADLLTSSGAQLLLAGPVGADVLQGARFVHHQLVPDASGAKMSKRDNADALRSIAQDAGGRRRLWDSAVRIGAAVGIAPP